MRWLLRLLLIVLMVVPLIAAALLVLAIDDTAQVQGAAILTPAHIERAKRLLVRNDPRRMRPGVLRTMVVSQEDLDLAANYLASQYVGGASRIVLQDGRATLRASVGLPANPLGRFVNIDLGLRETDGLPQVQALTIGRVPVPAFLRNWLLDRGRQWLLADARYGAAADVVRQVRSRDGFLSVVYAWNEAAPGQLKAALVGDAEQERWRLYQEQLAALTGQSGMPRAVSLDQLLGPLLQMAKQRSGSGEMAQESRAALIVLTFYVNGKGLAALVPQAGGWPPARRHMVTLVGRTDLTQHFMVSALIAATAGSPLSDVIGLYKELDDAKGGSGFSFTDLAADHAGTRFGVLAVAAGPQARRLHRVLDTGLTESDLVPEVRDLPEFMPAAEFQSRFGGVGRPAYQAMLERIDRRIAALPMYR